MFLSIPAFANPCEREIRIGKYKTQLVERIEKIALHKWVYVKDLITGRHSIKFTRLCNYKECDYNKCKKSVMEITIIIFYDGKLRINNNNVELTYKLTERLSNIYDRRQCMEKDPDEDFIVNILRFLNAI